jgi:ABC-type transport system substrate-binding protein/methyl-accepting chemotaxis protein
MSQDLKNTVIDRIRAPLAEYNTSFDELLKTSRHVEDRFVKDTELLSEIRKKFDNLTASVELEFEGIAVFDQEIKKTKEILEQSIVQVNESLAVSTRISKGLDDISKSFNSIQTYAAQLDDIVKNIATVSDNIEVASRNAGITAFHAGEKGRGFEVISREMTMLVRNVQKPTQLIPVISEEIVRGIEDLGQDLFRIGNIINDLGEINTRFSNITDELLSLIPNIEDGIKSLSSSVKSQRELQELLITENERSTVWLNNIQDISRSSAILEQYLEAIFRRISNIRESLIAIEDNTSFAWTLNSFKIALHDTSRSYAKGISDFSDKDIDQSGVQLSERSILQLVSEANQLYQVIENIAAEVKNWLKTNSVACDVLNKGVDFYQDIVNILESLNKKIQVMQKKSEYIEEPLFRLKKIMERSRILGLYASIESARGGQYADSLGVVTREIKNLSDKTTSFVSDIDDVAVNITKSFDELSAFLARSMSDVEQGVSSLKSAAAILEKNRDLLENLDNLALEMTRSTDTMKTQCNDLSTLVRELNNDYVAITQGFKKYTELISTCGTIAEDLLKNVSSFDKDIAVITRHPKTVVYRHPDEPIILDPAYKTDARSHEIIEQVFIGLVTFDPSNHIIPGMVDSFSVSKDGLAWDFKIKKNIRFHNGDTVNAKDVAHTITRVQGGPNVSFIDYIDDVVVLDELNLRFNLKFPYLPFLANLACGVCDITHRDFSPEKPNGAGPYKLIEWNKEKEIILEAFEDFFDGRPAIDRVEIRFIKNDDEAVELYKKGEIELMKVTPEMAKYFSPEELVSGPGLSTQYIGINVDKDTPFKNKKVRQAMNLALDNDAYIEVAMEGQAIPAHGVFPPGMYSYNRELAGYGFDLDRALRLMEEAGYGSGLENTYPFDTRDNETAIKRSEYIIKSLEKIGIKLILNPLPWSELLERGYRGDSLISMKGWVSDNGDPDNFLYPLFHSSSFGRAGNTFYYSNDNVDTMIESARSERNSQKRKTIYQNIEEIIVDDAPWIFLSHAVDWYVVSNKIGGFKVDPFGINKFRYLWSK